MTISVDPQAIAQLRQTLHQFPGVGMGEEVEPTRKIIRDFLDVNGIGYQEQAGSIIATIDSGVAGPTIGWRGDFDGLEITENTGAVYSSQVPNRMHACGHDGHTAVAAFIAKHFKDNPDDFVGKRMIIFQPGEEIGEGAKSLVESGFFKENPMQMLFGFHNFPDQMLPKGFEFGPGSVLTRSGQMLYGAYGFRITFHSGGGHAGNAGAVLDAGNAASQVYTRINTAPLLRHVISSPLFPTSAARYLTAKLLPNHFMAATTIHTVGNAFNVLPTEAQIIGGIRVRSDDKIEGAVGALTKICRDVMGNDNFKIETKKMIERLVNSTMPTEILLGEARGVIPAENVVSMPMPITVGDDFSEYGGVSPLCYFGLVASGKPLHTPGYDYDDAISETAIEIGVRTMNRAADTYAPAKYDRS